MISLEAHDLHLNYTVRQKLSLSMSDARSAHRTGNIETEGRNHIVHALKGISFSAKSGDRIGLLGKNGSGKTTLLKVLYGIFEPSSGYVNTNGKIDALFNINLGFRKGATGRRNVVLRGLINGWSVEEIEAKMDEIIEFSELGEFIDLPMKTYSQGMSARLAFSVATAMDPEILLMDEWIGAGDPTFQNKARQRMNSLTNNAGIIILASHNMALIKRTCSHILELNAGEMIRFCSVSEYFEPDEKTKIHKAPAKADLE